MTEADEADEADHARSDRIDDLKCEVFESIGLVRNPDDMTKIHKSDAERACYELWKMLFPSTEASQWLDLARFLGA